MLLSVHVPTAGDIEGCRARCAHTPEARRTDLLSDLVLLRRKQTAS